MKKIKILIPSLVAISAMPLITLVACGKNEPKVVTHTITFSAGEHGKLEGQTTITVQGDQTKFSDITKPSIVNIDAGWSFANWDHSDEYIINKDVTITALYQFNGVTVDLTEDKTETWGEGEYGRPKTESQQFTIDKDKIYHLNINASICPDGSFANPVYYSTFFIYKENTQPLEHIDFLIKKVIVNTIAFSWVNTVEETMREPGRYTFQNGTVWIHDFSELNPSFTMSLEIQFADTIAGNAIARWYGGS